MKRISVLFLALIICFSFIISSQEGAPKAVAATSNITMIVTNPAQNASTAMNINFHASLSYTGCFVQYTTVDDTDWANVKTQSGTYVTYGANSSNPFYNKYAKNDSGTDYYQTPTFLDYSVTLSNLTPATNYMYRISDGTNYTDTYKFKTAGSDEWSFVVTGDFHEYYKNYGVNRAAQAAKAINAAIALAPQVGAPAVEHIVSVGDIVAWGVDYGQWKNVYSQSWVKNYSFANAIGNHDDMDRSANSSSKYNAICNNNPLNGYGDEKGTCFYYIYNNVLFIYINYLDTSATAEAWANSVIAANQGSYKFSVLVNHRPATSKYSGSTYSYFWNYWADFCDDNNIDLVLAGDHHVYMRSQPLYNGAKVSNYSASNPNATVYIAADSSDGERGSSTDVVSFNSNIVASSYYRYKYSSSKADKTAILIHVGADKMTSRLVYYESSSSLSASATSSFYQGAVSGHSSFYYGDTYNIYPSNHGYVTPPSGGDENESGLPAAAKNYLASANGGTYKYSTSVYPGGASYYTQSYYGDNSSTGGTYMTGKLNDGVVPADSNPGSSNLNWATFFLNQGNPELYLDLSQSIYINNISLIYRNNEASFYGKAIINSIGIGEVDGSYGGTTAYTISDTVYSGSNNKLTITFTEPVKAKYIKILLSKPEEGTRVALGEAEVWGDTTIPVTGSFELTDNSEYVLDENYVNTLVPGVTVAGIKEQFKCDVKIYDANNAETVDTTYVGTGFKVKRFNAAGEVINEVLVIIPGDATGDGVVSTTDYVVTKSILTGHASFDEVYQKAADITCDGSIATTDCIVIKGYCKGARG